jgi:hypothetical protein
MADVTIADNTDEWIALHIAVRPNQSRLRTDPHRRDGDILILMSGQTKQLLEAFDGLPAEEKGIFTAEFLRKTIPFDSGPYDDQETADAADRLFAMLDAEENDARSR